MNIQLVVELFPIRKMFVNKKQIALTILLYWFITAKVTHYLRTTLQSFEISVV